MDGTAHRMAPDDGDWWAADVPGPGAGVDYRFRLDGGDLLPDPRSPWQPAGVSGPSRGYDHARVRLDRREAGGASRCRAR